ncbi:hypothetical protein CQA53_06085 [Helicobacter didelphidarum]|uniref:Uncharacterized protein n=1 Tax=Helicobacter didelphidarum TaxID=2040648 RepID=A0A3D8IK49_9HELI|nr:hypothetical protein [Helicobacter didelphidarum]RDU65727.1 hypothetical protein CQA53_06085 [Helicobacter didelphidarum]
MSFPTIKMILLIGTIWSIVASSIELVFAGHSVGRAFFFLSLVGQFIFLAGLFLLDRKTKSFLSGYYATMTCICILLYMIPKSSQNTLLILFIVFFFFFLLFRYLQIFTRISGQILFIRSFYTLVVCIILGIILLKYSNFIEKRVIVAFVVGFMIFPSLIMYISAIFSLQKVGLEKINKVIL